MSTLLTDLDALLADSADADEALRLAVQRLVGEPGVVWAGVAFSEQGRLVLGPAVGDPDESRRTRVPVTFQGETVGELLVDGEADAASLAEVAERVSAFVLIGWDTGGQVWDP